MSSFIADARLADARGDVGYGTDRKSERVDIARQDDSFPKAAILQFRVTDGAQLHKVIVEDTDCPPNVALIRLHPNAAADAFLD